MDLVVEVVCLLNDVKELLRKFVVVLETLYATVDVIVVVVLHDGVDLVLGLVSVPQVYELRVRHEENVIVEV